MGASLYLEADTAVGGTAVAATAAGGTAVAATAVGGTAVAGISVGVALAPQAAATAPAAVIADSRINSRRVILRTFIVLSSLKAGEWVHELVTVLGWYLG